MRVYEFVMEDTLISAAGELFLIAGPITSATQILRIQIGAEGGVGSELSRWQLWRTTTFNTGSGAALAAVKRELGDASAQCGVTRSDNTVANTYDSAPSISRPFNWLTGDEWVPATPEDKIVIPPGNTKYAAVVLAVAPASPKSVTCSVVLGELG